MGVIGHFGHVGLKYLPTLPVKVQKKDPVHGGAKTGCLEQQILWRAAAFQVAVIALRYTPPPLQVLGLVPPLPHPPGQVRYVRPLLPIRYDLFPASFLSQIWDLNQRKFQSERSLWTYTYPNLLFPSSFPWWLVGSRVKSQVKTVPGPWVLCTS